MTDPNSFVPSQRAFGGELPGLDASLLGSVDRPSRYIGGEVGQTRKDLSKVRSVVGLCYPDLYEIGMSHIGLKILYSLLNELPDVAAERVYAVAPDMEARLRDGQHLLATLENQVPLKHLDILGFTLQYELSYTNLLQVLDLGGIPLRTRDRQPEHPVVIAGGPCAFNPEPLAPFLDAVCLGDGEETILGVLRVVQDWRARGGSREKLHWMLTEVPGVYVPALYSVEYLDDGRVGAIIPSAGLPSRIRKAVLTDIDSAPYPTVTPVPFTKVVHDRVGVEIQRGCMRGCRFCQAGYIYRPERQRSPETIQRLVREGLAATGHEDYSLLSLSAGDYNCIEPLLTSLMDEHEQKRAAIGLPSMRLETLSPGIMEQIERVRKTSFTVAPEAGSDRMRGVINKVIDEDVLIDMVDEVFRRGWKSLKFYFMLGLPTEQYEDLYAMVDLGARCLSRARRHNRSAGITVSVSSFVPKSHTPFQWAPQITLEEIREKQDYLRRELRRAKLGFRYHASQSSVMEGIYSRGDRRSADSLERAYELGARMDGWQEHFDQDAWDSAFEQCGLDPAFYNQRRRDATEVFPWDHVDIGMKPSWLWDDWMDSLEAGFVPDCSDEPCYDCGVCDHKIVHNRVYPSGEDGPAEPVHRQRKPWAGAGSRKVVDPQFVAMPRPPAKKANNVVDAVPPVGMAPGSGGARMAREAQALRRAAEQAASAEGGDSAAGKAGASEQASSRKSARMPRKAPGSELADIFDTRLPPEHRLKLEVRFGKTGALVHLGNLEVMGAFRRALRRIEAPLIWSQGFHPQARVSFGPPLPAGMASVSEYAEIELKRPVDVGPLVERLREAMPEGLPILDARVSAPHQSAIAARMTGWTYRVACITQLVDDARRSVATFLEAEEVLLESTRKGKTRTIDVRPAVVRLEEVDEPGVFELQTVAGGPGARVRDVLRAIFGEDAAVLRPGWQVTRWTTQFDALERGCRDAGPQADRPPAQVEA